jgi:NAD+ kinase
MANDRQHDLRVIVLHSSQSDDVVNTAQSLVAQLSADANIHVAGVFESSDSIPVDANADIAVVVGGDGSILRGCRQLGEYQIPIVGVNLGRLGFLADLSPEQLISGLPQLKSGQYQITRHLMFQCRHHHADGTVLSDLGLNEVCVTSAGTLKMVDIALDIDGEHVTTFSCDGLIVSTPVGSTAHNLSAGGPILRQELQAIVVTPICPHTLTVRPIVDSADRQYAISVADATEGVMLTIDGQIHRPVGPGDRILIERAEQAFQLLRLPGHSYYGTLHRKLGWHGQLDYRERRGNQ